MERFRISRRRTLIAATMGAFLLLAACSSKSSTNAGYGGTYGGSTGGSTGGSGTSSTSSVSNGNATGVGAVLVNQDGRTLYLFMPEKGSTIACTGSCATTWPPLLVPSGAKSAATSGTAKASMIGTVSLPGGQQEVTYNGWPLHTYSGDSAAGQANGQGIGGQWFAVSVSGGAASAGTSSSGTAGGGGGGGYGNGGGGGY